MIELLRQRRSIRQFADKPIEPEKLELLKETLLRSPTSRNLDPWEFIIVDDAKLLDRLSRSKPHGAAFLKDAPLGIVIAADPDKSDVWIEDCSIASILLQLTAQSLGLGNCWIQIRNRMHSKKTSAEKYIQNLLQIPKKLKVLSIITFGYPAKTREGKSFEELQFEKIRMNKF